MDLLFWLTKRDTGHVELDITYEEELTWIEDPCAQLEEGHDDLLKQELEVDRALLHKVHQHRLLNHKQQNTLYLIYTIYRQKKNTGENRTHLKK